jgi:hypothetical protein
MDRVLGAHGIAQEQKGRKRTNLPSPGQANPTLRSHVVGIGDSAGRFPIGLDLTVFRRGECECETVSVGKQMPPHGDLDGNGRRLLAAPPPTPRAEPGH